MHMASRAPEHRAPHFNPRRVGQRHHSHKKSAVVHWLVAHPRFYLYFGPTRACWSNVVERWFPALTTSRLRRGIYRSVMARGRGFVNFAGRTMPAGVGSCGRSRPTRSRHVSLGCALRTLAAHAG